MQCIAAEEGLHECPTEIKDAHVGFDSWELQSIKIFLLFLFIWVWMESMTPPKGMKARSGPST